MFPLPARSGQVGTCDADRPLNWFECLVLSSIVAPNTTCAATASCPVAYGWKGGTSMASPHIAGVAALVKDANPGISARQVKNIIKQTTDKIGHRQLFGHGVVNAAAAVGAELEEVRVRGISQAGRISGSGRSVSVSRRRGLAS